MSGLWSIFCASLVQENLHLHWKKEAVILAYAQTDGKTATVKSEVRFDITGCLCTCSISAMCAVLRHWNNLHEIVKGEKKEITI